MNKQAVSKPQSPVSKDETPMYLHHNNSLAVAALDKLLKEEQPEKTVCNDGGTQSNYSISTTTKQPNKEEPEMTIQIETKGIEKG